MIKQMLEKNEQYKELLFIRGYLITNAQINKNEYPFYGKWTKHLLGEYCCFVHPLQHFFKYNDGINTYFLIGNCVNPYDGELDENIILKKLAEASKENDESGVEYLNSLTGSFIIGRVKEEKIDFVTDPSGMLYCCYGKVGENVYVSSHYQLIADICPLTKSKYIKRLEKYKHFYKYGLFFPGDLTPFVELTRAVQNHFISYDGTFSIKRFYPIEKLQPCNNEEEYESTVKECVRVLKKTLELASKKWEDIAISLTGGMDSKTTLAAANGLYDKFSYYSYISMPGDKIDAEAAHKIAENVGINHQIINISQSDDDFEDIEIKRAIISHNNGEYKSNPNDVRKRVYFQKNSSFTEVKSWISEIARANYYKKFGVKKMPKRLSARNMTSMYKIFTTQRRLAKETDKIFESFIEKTGFNLIPQGYDSSDMYLWEFRYSAWGGIVITSEQSFSNEIFIPYNNRRLLNEMLKAPKEKRISDEFHEDLIKEGNPKVDELGITVTNWNETKKRQVFEKIYFKLNSFIPF